MLNGHEKFSLQRQQSDELWSCVLENKLIKGKLLQSWNSINKIAKQDSRIAMALCYKQCLYENCAVLFQNYL